MAYEADRVTQPKSPYKAADEQKLMAHIWSPAIADDPLAFVMFAFPWGKDGTPLAKQKGPRSWQKKELIAIRDHIAMNRNRMTNGQPPLVYKSATVSGRGIGKSALVAWINLWLMSTVLGASAITTANTEDQLKSKTWAELGKWHTMAINSHWFEKSTMALKPAPWFEDALKTQMKIDTGYYYAKAQLWSEENPDAFAGVHNMAGIVLIMDEASGIPAAIWKVSEGFFTEPVLHRYWFCFSNGRRNTGTFFECFHKDRKFWRRNHIDARTVEGTDPAVYAEIIEKHGEDSDEARVEVKGEFPRQGDKQFISRELVADAADRELQSDDWAPLIMGIDIARFGDDKTVFRWRQGRDARSIPAVEIKGMDNMVVANEAAHWIQKLNPDAVCIDAGNGTGVIDRLREMGYKVNEVWFGSASPKPEWANNRTFMWAEMRDWLRGAAIDANQELIDDLTGPMYKFQGTSDRQRLETKEEMKARGLASPDHGDALACTFAIKVARRDTKTSRHHGRDRVAPGSDFSIFGRGD